MYALDLAAVKDWKKVGQFWCPASINLHCPHPGCGEKGTFVTGHKIIFENKGLLMVGQCPTCQKEVLFVVAHPGESQYADRPRCQGLAVWPTPTLPREPVKGSELLPGAVREVYRDALDSFNAGTWRPTMVVCRVVLEAITDSLGFGGNGPLFQRLKTMAEQRDLAAPLHKLTGILRKGGNTGAHFDPQRTPNQQAAEAMLDLTEYLLEYLYTLPRLIDDLEKKLDELQQ